jgi:hypothetical protein
MRKKAGTRHMSDIERIIKDALLANGYQDDNGISAEEMASIIAWELGENGVIAPWNED